MIWSLAGRLAQSLPGEAAHRLAVKALAHGLGPKCPPDHFGDALNTSVAGMDFANPLGLAAGFDKDAEAMEGAFGLGFGMVEIGTVTPQPQPGNPKPRVFRLGRDNAVINRYGFNNSGMEAAAGRLTRFRQGYHGKGVLGVNIGANKDSADRVQDYHACARRLAPFADYLTVNVSSPNTPGLRGLQEPEFLAEVLDAAREGMTAAGAIRPVMLKLAPDLDRAGLEAAVGVAVERGCSGLIIANTTISRPQHLKSQHRHEAGGLSGAPVFGLSTEMLHDCRRMAPEGFPLIAVGGVRDAATAYAKILAGGDLVQLYTGLAISDAGLPRRILNGLDQYLARDGFSTIADAVGAASSVDEACRISGVSLMG